MENNGSEKHLHQAGKETEGSGDNYHALYPSGYTSASVVSRRFSRHGLDRAIIWFALAVFMALVSMNVAKGEPRERKTSDVQCEGVTKVGLRCKRHAAKGDKYCYQHGKTAVSAPNAPVVRVEQPVFRSSRQ